MKRKPRLGEGSGQDEEEKKEKENKRKRKGKGKEKQKEKKRKKKEKKGKEKEGRGDWCELLSLCIVAGTRAFVAMLYVTPRRQFGGKNLRNKPSRVAL